MQREIRSLEQIEDRQRKREDDRANENPNNAECFCPTEQRKEDQQTVNLDTRADYPRSDQHIDLTDAAAAPNKKDDRFHPVAGHDQDERRRCPDQRRT